MTCTRIILTLAFSFTALAAAAEAPPAKPGDVIWTFKMPPGRNQNHLFPVANKEKVCLVTNGPGAAYDNWVYCLDLKTGATLWEVDLGDVCCAEPALASDRLIVTATDRNLTFAKTFCLALKDGKKLWEHHHGDWLTTPNMARYRPSICGDQVAIVGWSKKPGVIVPGYSRLICLELRDGYETWNTNEATTGMFSRLSEQLNGKIYFWMTRVEPTGNIKFYNLHSFATATGKLSEDVKLPLDPTSHSMLEPITDHGRLYLRPDEDTLTCYEVGKFAKPLWAIETGVSSWVPAVQGERVVLTLQSGHAIAYNANDGKRAWRRYVNPKLETPVTDKNHAIIYDDQTVSALRLDNGAMLWEFRAPRPILYGRPCIESGILIVPAINLTERVAMYALKLADSLPPP